MPATKQDKFESEFNKIKREVKIMQEFCIDLEAENPTIEHHENDDYDMCAWGDDDSEGYVF
jgi:hypothetical protein